MCGEVPAGHYAIDVVVHLAANQTNVVIPLPRKMEWLSEIWLNEYQVIGSPSIGLFRLNLKNLLQQQEVTNAVGEGYCVLVDSTVVSHIVYQKPRVVTVNKRGQVHQLEVNLQDVTGNALAVPTFTSATFMFTFIMRDPHWSPEHTIAGDKLLPQNAAGQFSTRAPFF